MRFKLSCLVVLVGLVCFSSTPSAQQLSIKRHWFTGNYKYSTDGVNYFDFGKGWGSFKEVVKENQEALGLVSSARSLNTASQVFGFAGGALLGWNIGTELGGRDAEPSIWIAGGALLVTGMTLDIMAHSKLKKTVKIYNSATGESPQDLGNMERLSISLYPGYLRVIYSF
jgi:hypothetical protein